MKKLFTLLWLLVAAFTFKASAQVTNCNADFTFQILSGSNVKFTPVMTDSPYAHHSWVYGDGSPAEQLVSPTHNFALPGTYAVVHTITFIGTNGTVYCTQSITKTVIIESPCTLVVDFSSLAFS